MSSRILQAHDKELVKSEYQVCVQTMPLSQYIMLRKPFTTPKWEFGVAKLGIDTFNFLVLTFR